jgi:hypothetical protein
VVLVEDAMECEAHRLWTAELLRTQVDHLYNMLVVGEEKLPRSGKKVVEKLVFPIPIRKTINRFAHWLFQVKFLCFFLTFFHCVCAGESNSN